MIITIHGTLSSPYPFGVWKGEAQLAITLPRAQRLPTSAAADGRWCALEGGALSITLEVINATRYAGGIVIQSFGDADTARVWRREHVRRLGSDLQRARHVASELRAGRVVINGMTDDPQAPWGGFKYSGVGREYGRYGIEAFLETRAILES